MTFLHVETVTGEDDKITVLPPFAEESGPFHGVQVSDKLIIGFAMKGGALADAVKVAVKKGKFWIPDGGKSKRRYEQFTVSIIPMGTIVKEVLGGIVKPPDSAPGGEN